MREEQVARLLESVRRGETSVAEALQALRTLPYEDLGFAKVDHHRLFRKGFPEVIYCPGKTPEQIVAIALRLSASGTMLLATRAGMADFKALQAAFPAAIYHSAARAVVLPADNLPSERSGCVVVITAGTADIPVAEEAVLTAELMGSRVERLYDVGVAGLHRLLDRHALIDRARVLIVAAGMDGALASVVGGLARGPVIAVPTSSGYGAHFGGLAPLLTMLSSCAAGVAVVNIDNGFGAGYIAALVNRAGGGGCCSGT